MRNEENERCPGGSWDVELDLSGGGYLMSRYQDREKETIFSGRQNKQLRMRDCCWYKILFSFYFSPSVKNVHLESPGEVRHKRFVLIFSALR